LFQKAPVQIWLYENVDVRIQGVIIGFDEFMNIVLDGAEEIRQDDAKTRIPLGRILLKGDNISVLQNAVK
jgi:small nuclear ribonucleoprotein E